LLTGVDGDHEHGCEQCEIQNNGYNQVDTEVHQELKNFGIVPTARGISDSTYSCARAVLEKQRAYRSSNSLRRKSTYNAAIQCSFGQSNDLMDHASEDAEENEFQVFTTM